MKCQGKNVCLKEGGHSGRVREVVVSRGNLRLAPFTCRKWFCDTAVDIVRGVGFDVEDAEPSCLNCEDCQKMVSFNQSDPVRFKYRCYGSVFSVEIKKDIGAEQPETSPDWCPLRRASDG